jgi:hypothetical protein
MSLGRNRLLGMLMLLAFVAGGCSDDDNTADDASVVIDQGAPDLAPADQAGPQPSINTQLSLHGGASALNFALGKPVFANETWDLNMPHGDPVDTGPHIVLAAGVTAKSLGAVGFHETTTAPADGYQADDAANKTYAIGSSWRTGGDGGTAPGFTMSSFIYAIKLADGTYAKLEVLKAFAGTIDIRFYHQANGSQDLTTVEPQ